MAEEEEQDAAVVLERHGEDEDDDPSRPHGPRVNVELRRLELARADVQQRLGASTTDAYRALLIQTLDALDEKISTLR